MNGHFFSTHLVFELPCVFVTINYMASMHTIQTIFSQNHKNCIANTFSGFLIKFTLRAQSEELIINNLVEQNKYLKDVLKIDYSG